MRANYVPINYSEIKTADRYYYTYKVLHLFLLSLSSTPQVKIFYIGPTNGCKFFRLKPEFTILHEPLKLFLSNLYCSLFRH